MHQPVDPLLVGFHQHVADVEQHIQSAAIANGAAVPIAQVVEHREAMHIKGNVVATGNRASFGVGDPQVCLSGEFFKVFQVADVDLIGGQVF
jgi:hypothetical protein